MWLQPEFAFSFRRADMDVSRFPAFIGIKVEPPQSDAQDCRHGGTLPRRPEVAQGFSFPRSQVAFGNEGMKEGELDY